MPFVEKTLEILGRIATNETNLGLMAKCLINNHVVPFVGAGLSVEFNYPAWSQFLVEAADQFGLCREVAPFLANLQFEEAAEILDKHAPPAFDDFIRDKFDEAKIDEKKIARPLQSGAVRHLPGCARGFVITTNFDHLIEAAFRDAKRAFQKIITPANVREVSRAIHLRQNVLLKLHGDYDDTQNRILALSDYKKAYGSDDPATSHLENPLPSILALILETCPLLFLGCSLKADRTTRIIAHIAKKFEGTMHFALLSDLENTPERVKELYGWNIRPLFFAANKFEKVEQFLACLADEVRQVPVPLLKPEVRLLPKPHLSDFVERPEEYGKAKQLILNRSTRVATALTGAGGFGKTTLAEALYNDPDIRQRFSDGVFWIDVGQTPNILERLGCLYKEVTGTNLNTADEREAIVLVAAALGDRSMLLVIDDVWNRSHLQSFLDASPSSKHLITTRVREILGNKVDLVHVDEMLPDQAAKLLLNGIVVQELGSDLPYEDSPDLKDLAGRLGHCPLFLELANGMLNADFQGRDGTLAAAIEFVRGEYERYGIDGLGDSEEKRNDAAAKCITLNLELLEEPARTNYRKLAIFPDETPIPFNVAAELWDADLSDAEHALRRFDKLSLVKYFPADKTFRLHKVFCDWLRRQAAETASRDEGAQWSQELGRDPDTAETSLKALHCHLLSRWRASDNLPHLYAWRWIGWHSKEAGQLEWIRGLLLRLRWIQEKLRYVSLESLIADYEFVQPSEPHRLLRRALTQSSHVISNDQTQLANQLYARVLGVKEPALTDLCKELHDELYAQSGCIVPLWPSLTQADSELLRTLVGHVDKVMALALSGTGNILVSGCADGAIKVWDLATGREMHTLAGHEDAVLSVALSSDGNTLVSSSDNAIKVWNLKTEKTRILEEPPCKERSVTLSGDGHTLVFTSSGNTIKVWDMMSGKVRTLEVRMNGPKSWTASADGRTLIFGSPDGFPDSSPDTTVRV